MFVLCSRVLASSRPQQVSSKQGASAGEQGRGLALACEQQDNLMLASLLGLRTGVTGGSCVVDTPYLSLLRTGNFPHQIVSIPILASGETSIVDISIPVTTSFHLSKDDLDRITRKNLIGKFRMRLDLKGFVKDGRAMELHSKWVAIGKKRGMDQQHLMMKAEPDARFVFEFDGVIECNLQVLMAT
ncbi:hypothetical protein ZIOFF_064206 [Zingiber officinale]|uniref:Uncharacterized protein n=1 Tax=Zingiber officinale TaxID=94328 RepID=A0A8J5CFI1_ZINOF|nr:hypothetical protein ZIOFF_064206 [Zingiber officinale]